jgi:hypothetical protein
VTDLANDRPVRPDSRVRRTTVPHPQRWRSPHQAGWSVARRNAAPPVARAGESPVAASPFGRPVRRFRKFVVYTATAADGDAFVAAKRAELEMFGVASGWATDECIAAGEIIDYAQYDSRSQFFVATTAADPAKPVAVARMVWPDAELPLEQRFETTAVHQIDPQWSWMIEHVGAHRVGEWTTIGTAGSSPTPMFALWSAVFRASLARGVDYWVQSVVVDLFDTYRSAFKAPLIQIGPKESIYGIDAIPTMLSLQEIGVGPMLSWNPELKRSMFGSLMERPAFEADPNDLQDLRVA